MKGFDLFSFLRREALFAITLFSLSFPSPFSAGEITVYSPEGVETLKIPESPRSGLTEGYKRLGETCILNCGEQQGNKESPPLASREGPGQSVDRNGSGTNVNVQITINEPAVQYPVIPYWYAPPLRPPHPPKPPGSISPPPR